MNANQLDQLILTYNYEPDLQTPLSFKQKIKHD